MLCTGPTFSHCASHPVILEAMLFEECVCVGGGVLTGARKPLEFRQRVGVESEGVEVQVGPPLGVTSCRVPWARLHETVLGWLPSSYPVAHLPQPPRRCCKSEVLTDFTESKRTPLFSALMIYLGFWGTRGALVTLPAAWRLGVLTGSMPATNLPPPLVPGQVHRPHLLPRRLATVHPREGGGAAGVPARSQAQARGLLPAGHIGGETVSQAGLKMPLSAGTRLGGSCCA